MSGGKSFDNFGPHYQKLSLYKAPLETEIARFSFATDCVIRLMSNDNCQYICRVYVVFYQIDPNGR